MFGWSLEFVSNLFPHFVAPQSFQTPICLILLRPVLTISDALTDEDESDFLTPLAPSPVRYRRVKASSEAREEVEEEEDEVEQGAGTKMENILVRSKGNPLNALIPLNASPAIVPGSPAI